MEIDAGGAGLHREAMETTPQRAHTASAKRHPAGSGRARAMAASERVGQCGVAPFSAHARTDAEGGVAQSGCALELSALVDRCGARCLASALGRDSERR